MTLASALTSHEGAARTDLEVRAFLANILSNQQTTIRVSALNFLRAPFVVFGKPLANASALSLLTTTQQFKLQIQHLPYMKM